MIPFVGKRCKSNF